MNIMKIHILLSLIFIITCEIKSFAQIVIEPSTYIQEAKIGLVDEFIKRFNGQELHPNISCTDSTYRRDNMLHLFNASIEKKDSILNEIQIFIDTISQDSTILNYSDTTWFAIANCKGTLYGKPVNFDLYLSVQYRFDDMYKWVIAKADGKCFNVAPRDSSENIILSPDSHETKFISLRRMTIEQPFNVSLFMTNGFEYDQTSTFVYLVKSNKLKIDYVENLEFVFTQVPGYVFHIKYFERESTNSGWLINRFYKIDDRIKSEMLHSLHINYKLEKNINKNDVTYNDSSNVSVTKNILNERLLEKSQIACDCLNYIQTTDNINTRKFYIKKFRNLFTEDAIVHINDLRSSSLLKVTIDTFCDKILKKNNECIYIIDSISIPIGKEFIELKNISSLNPTIHNSLSIKDSNKTLIIVEETEDGTEFSTYLGNLFIIKKEK